MSLPKVYTAMNITINKTIGIGDAGLPFGVTIDVEYEQHGNTVLVIDWMERESPYDNPPELWYAQMREIIDEHFLSNRVVFQKGVPVCFCGVPNDLHSTTMCGWDAALMPSNELGIINDSRHPGFGKPFMSWKPMNSIALNQ